MPAKQGVRCDDTPHPVQYLAAKKFAFYGQATPLIFVEPGPLLPIQLPPRLVFLEKVIDDLVVFPVNPASERIQ
jgi:hypothetical protein